MPLCQDSVTPRGGLYELPWASQQEIDEFAAGLSEVQREMRLGFTRYPRTDCAYYSAWGSHLVLDQPPSWWFEELAAAGRERRQSRIRVGVGVDHGSKPGAQVAILVAIMGYGLHARIWILDEYVSGSTTSEQDAVGVVAMLRRNGLEIKDVDLWVGDRAHDFRGGRKANQYFRQGLAKQLGFDISRRGWGDKIPRPLQMMAVPRKSLNSAYEGADIIHRRMLRGPDYYAVSSCCKSLDESHRTWRGGQREPAKDACDAERYIVVPMMEGRHR